MDPVSPYPAIAALFLGLACAWCIARRAGGPPEQGRFASIDGLRGYLAFFVFLHHSAIWYFCLRTGQWKVPPSNLYTHFGQSSVAMFFMITGFLFSLKLIDRPMESRFGRRVSRESGSKPKAPPAYASTSCDDRPPRWSRCSAPVADPPPQASFKNAWCVKPPPDFRSSCRVPAAARRAK